MSPSHPTFSLRMDCGDCATFPCPHRRERASSHLSQSRCRTLTTPRSAAAAAACRRTVCVAARLGRPRLNPPPSNAQRRFSSSEKSRRLASPVSPASPVILPVSQAGRCRRISRWSAHVKIWNGCEKCAEMSHRGRVWSSLTFCFWRPPAKLRSSCCSFGVFTGWPL